MKGAWCVGRGEGGVRDEERMGCAVRRGWCGGGWRGLCGG